MPGDPGATISRKSARPTTIATTTAPIAKAVRSRGIDREPPSARAVDAMQCSIAADSGPGSASDEAHVPWNQPEPSVTKPAFAPVAPAREGVVVAESGLVAGSADVVGSTWRDAARAPTLRIEAAFEDCPQGPSRRDRGCGCLGRSDRRTDRARGDRGPRLRAAHARGAQSRGHSRRGRGAVPRRVLSVREPAVRAQRVD